MPQIEKCDGYIHVFMCNQASGSSSNFSWRHMQTGSRYPPKPEVVITRRREDISTWSQRLRHTFWACSIHLHLRRPLPTMENAIGCKPEVETVSQTGSTINLATETDIDAISVSIPMFLGARFSLVYKPTSPDASFIQKFKDSGWIPVTGSSYNFGTKTGINVISMQWVGRARNLCRSSRDHLDIVFRHNAITTSDIRPPSWSGVSGWRKRRASLAYTPVKNLLPKHRYSHWDCVDICFRCWVISTSGLG